MKCLVLGATGIIGNHIVRELIAQGHDVTAASRGVTPSLNLDDLKIKRVYANLNDLDSLTKAFTDMDWVFQAAAYYPKTAFHKQQHLNLARKELENVLTALKQSNIKRLVYTSSLTTIGKSKNNEPATEKNYYDLYKHDPHPYFLVKYVSEEMIGEAVNKHKLPIVMVNPTGCFGPYELKPKKNCLIPQLIEKKVPVLVNNAMNVVDTSDVARGQILAAEKGHVGERYILGGHNTTLKEVVSEICRVAGVRGPLLSVPVTAGLALCYADEALSLFLKKSPNFPALALRFIQHGQHLSIAKAQTELGYTVSPMQLCYEKAIAWYKKIGYVNG